MMLRPALVALGLLFASLPALRADEPAKADPAKKDPQKANFTKDVAPLLASYCTKCHGGERPRAGLNLEKYTDEAAVLKDRKVWEKVLDNVRAREMPPGSRPKPTPAEVEFLCGWVETKFGFADCNVKKDPGRVTIRRLNRAEYNNTIRDLVGVDFKPADDFPSDDVGYGFDNIGDVLSMPPVLMEKYLAAADKVVERAWQSAELRKRILVCEPKGDDKGACARKVIGEFARRAYRRPVTEDEVARLARFVELAEKNGDGFDKGVQLACKAALVSPHFLFRIETDAEPTNPDAAHAVNEYELATRLSYFLWSSMPDEELFRQAKAGTLRKDLDGQVRRMLEDPRAKALVENFAGQWLQIRNLRTISPDTSRFPTWNDGLRDAMRKETEVFFEAVVREDRSILDFIDADFTFVNEKLASLYGLEGIKGDEFRRVQLSGGQRGGVLTQASILTITSNPTRTSPVKRGKWILENILGTPPPPPPPGAGDLKDDKEAVLSGSLRQRMEQHRANAVCASCHARMDPLGFGFENFDAIGGWRSKDGSFDIDPSGVLPDGKAFQGPAELKVILKGQKEPFGKCLGEKMLTYALGRGLEYYDKCAVDQIAAGLAKHDYRFSALVLEVVRSDPFQMRRGQRIRR